MTSNPIKGPLYPVRKTPSQTPIHTIGEVPSNIPITFDKWIEEQKSILRSTFDPTLLFSADDLTCAMGFGWNARQAQVDALGKTIQELSLMIKKLR
jgi:hypothetical protein